MCAAHTPDPHDTETTEEAGRTGCARTGATGANNLRRQYEDGGACGPTDIAGSSKHHRLVRDERATRMFVAFFQFAAALIALRRVARSVAGETARVVVMGALVGVGLTTITVAQQVPHETYGQSVTRSVAERKAPKVLEVVNVRQNLYVAYGGGGNSAIFVTDLGVVLVDTSWAGWGQVILDQIKKITDKPVTTIINTHAHGDHSDGNTEFAFNVEFIAHENTRTNMERGDTTQAPMPDFSGEKAAFLPKRTFKDRLSLFSGKDRMDLHYLWGGSHEWRHCYRMADVGCGSGRRSLSGEEAAAGRRPEWR